MRRFLLALAFSLIPGLGWAACQPSAARPGEMGCQPVATSILPSDFIETWAPGLYPASAQIIRLNTLFGSPGAIGGITPSSGTFSSLLVTGGAHVNGDTQVDGTLTAAAISSPSATLGSLHVTGDAQIDGTLTASTAVVAPVIGGVFYAPGVKADGTTSDDVALKAAVDACAAKGGLLMLPPGKIRLTGAATISLSNCHIVGTGVPAGGSNAAAPTMGTTFQIESTTVKPFVCKSQWAMSGVNFWYPNQTNGTTVYPPTISDDGTLQCHHATMDHFVVVNAYEFLVDTPRLSWENMQFSDFNCYAVKTCFSLSLTGDSFTFVNARFTPTPWFDICNFSGPCTTAINAAAHVNAIFRITGVPSSPNPGVTLTLGGSESFAWRYGFKVESNGLMEGSVIDINWDGTGTLIDATATGATWGINNILRGMVTQCSTINIGGAGEVSNCFQMGSTSSLVLDHFSGSASGDWFQSSGSTLYMTGGLIGGIGLADNGNDHYLVNVSAGGVLVHIRGIEIGYAQTVGAHKHAIKTDHVQDFVLTNSSFRGFNEVVAGPYPGQQGMIAGNTGIGIQAPAVSLTGSGSIRYQMNQWDNPPLATVGPCGTGATINGTTNGGVGVGTGAGISCTITLPINIPLMTCQFGLSIATPFSTVQLSAGVWRLQAGVDISGTQITYRCGGDS